MIEWLTNAVKTVNGFLADYILVILLIAVGLFYTIKTKFVQVRCFGQGLRNVFAKRDKTNHKGGMSPFQAFTTAVAAQVGTGNIVGACGAILVGGPGAIFWMWIIAFFGMATIYAEAVLAQKTRKVNEDGSVAGGPVYYIKQAFKGKFGKFLAGFFAVAVVIALGFIGTMVQSNAISSAVSTATGVDSWVVGLIVGILLVVVAGVIFIGGAKRVASFTEKIVPIMAIIYLLGGIIILCIRITALPQAIGMIFKYAFTPNALIGGGIGAAIKTAVSMGAKRGLFSNEAGMGSTPHAHAQANVETAHEQGCTAMIGVFFDTFIVLTMTALIVISCLYAGNGAIFTASEAALSQGADMEGVQTAISAVGIDKNNAITMSIASLFADASLGAQIGSIFVAVCLTFFAFSTVISWNLFGRINFEYLFGKKATVVYSIIALIFILLGSLASSDLVWELSDFVNYLMVLPNALALFFLSKMVITELKENGKKSFKDTPNKPLAEMPSSSEK